VLLCAVLCAGDHSVRAAAAGDGELGSGGEQIFLAGLCGVDFICPSGPVGVALHTPVLFVCHHSQLELTVKQLLELTVSFCSGYLYMRCCCPVYVGVYRSRRWSSS
jgi:hypothetical protein